MSGRHDDPALGARLRELRRRRGLSQARLAEVIGISPSYLNLIEHDKRPLPGHLLLAAADALQVDAREFSPERTQDLERELLLALDNPGLEGLEIAAQDARTVAREHPAVARAVIALHRAWEGAVEAAETLAGQFLHVGTVPGVDVSRLPSEEANDLVQRNGNYFPDIEAAAEAVWARGGVHTSTLEADLTRILEREHGALVRVSPTRPGGPIRSYDPERRTLVLAEHLPERARAFHLAHQLGLLTLSDACERIADAEGLIGPSRALCRVVLANYFAAAVIMPYGPFHEAALDERYDVEVLARRFRTGFEQVCHRLTTLRRPGSEGISFHFVKTDIAGNVSKRFSGSGIPFARFAGACPRWNVNTAFLYPGEIRRQVSVMPDGERYFCISRTVVRRPGGWHNPPVVHAVGLGCRVEDAKPMIYTDGVDLTDRKGDIPIGTSCRLCPRTDCDQRAFPPIHQPLDIDPNGRGVAFYATSWRSGGS